MRMKDNKQANIHVKAQTTQTGTKTQRKKKKKYENTNHTKRHTHQCIIEENRVGRDSRKEEKCIGFYRQITDKKSDSAVYEQK